MKNYEVEIMTVFYDVVQVEAEDPEEAQVEARKRKNLNLGMTYSEAEIGKVYEIRTVTCDTNVPGGRTNTYRVEV